MAAHNTHIIQGEYAASAEPGWVITTMLGSCVAACLWDPTARIGGMNHILLADGTGSASRASSYGVNAMELLINAIIKHGGEKRRLEAKLFGGAQMLGGASDIGRSNAKFAEEFLAAEGIALRAASLGGTRARRIRFWPATGRALQKFVATADLAETTVQAPPPAPSPDVDLF